MHPGSAQTFFDVPGQGPIISPGRGNSGCNGARTNQVPTFDISMSEVATVQESAPEINPCTTCGACCAHFRCSFYWGEADDSPGGTVPVDLTEQITPWRRAMKGMSSKTPRCIALVGEIGREVGCGIYPVRSSVCREFPYSWQDGVHNERCDQARATWGLPPLPSPTEQK